MTWGLNTVLKLILLNIGHFGSLRTKTSKTVHDVRKLVLRGTSMPKPIWRDFKSWKSKKIGRKVVNRCLRWFMLKWPGPNPEGPTKGTWEGP